VCEQNLPLSAFSKAKKQRKERFTLCRQCASARRLVDGVISPDEFKRVKRQAEARLNETGSTKYCSVCLTVLPLKEFANAKGRRKEKACECRNCRKEYKARTKEHNREVAVFRLYGIAQKQFESMLKDRQGKCKICKTKTPGRHGFEIDHNHTTGKVRGLLCHRCNKAIGLFDDNIETAVSAAKYLEEIR